MKTILSVDDEKNILKSFEAVLGAEGYDIQTTTDPREGLNILADGHKDLVMLDVHMPGINGFEVYRELKKKKDTTAVLFVSAYPASFSADSDSFVKMWQSEFADGNTDDIGDTSTLADPSVVEALVAGRI